MDQQQEITVSFIVPFYNVEPYFVECLDSLLRQSVSKEIILINDGSTDQSLAIALRYAQQHPEIIVIHTQQNRGQSHARNQGLKLARGQYIHFVDSDDIIAGDDLAGILQVAQQHNVDIVRIGARKFLHENYDMMSNPMPFAGQNHDRSQAYKYHSYDYLCAIAHRDWIPGICWNLMKRSFLERNHLKFIEGVRAEDQLFYIQVLTCQPDIQVLEFINDIYMYRMHNTSTTATANLKYVIDHFTICDYIQQWQQQHLDFPKELQDKITLVRSANYTMAYGLALKLPHHEQQMVDAYFTDEIIELIKSYADYMSSFEQQI